MEMLWEGISFFLFWDEGQLTQRACESVKSILTDSTVVYVRFLRGDSRPLWASTADYSCDCNGNIHWVFKPSE